MYKLSKHIYTGSAGVPGALLYFRNMPEFFEPKELFSIMNNVEAQKEAEENLRFFEFDNNKKSLSRR